MKLEILLDTGYKKEKIQVLPFDIYSSIFLTFNFELCLKTEIAKLSFINSLVALWRGVISGAENFVNPSASITLNWNVSNFRRVYRCNPYGGVAKGDYGGGNKEKGKDGGSEIDHRGGR